MSSSVFGSRGQPTPPNLARQFTARLQSRNFDSDPAGNMEALSDALLNDACRERVSDVHLMPAGDMMRIRFRVDGDLIDAAQVSQAMGERVINHFRAIGDIDTSHLFRPVESRLTYMLDNEELDLRLAVTPCMGGEAMVIRVLHPETVQQNIDSLGLIDSDLQRVSDWLDTASGMLLVSGPTGSGKTTTVYALLHELKQLRRSIYTIEEPVEYQIPGICQIEVDVDHGLDFATGLRSLLRMDSDFLMVGEVRDHRTADAALDAAVRGRTLMSTIHSRDVSGVITTLRNWDIQNHEIAAAVTLVIAQRLVRKLCPECRKEKRPTEEQLRWLRSAGVENVRGVFHKGGCDHCHGLGHLGRTGIFEVWQVDEDDYEAVLAGKDERAIQRDLLDRGHRTMLRDGLEKAEMGIISLDELRRVPDLLPHRRPGSMDIAAEATEPVGSSQADE
ncbi:GspE/PulE family protein [Phycisphaerales bacterium AB-hyl4]|uniref:GspE/PulE family protein n=1 Tax=Natronomicrosphaera hydrolytica TaxID=3242702 RepID=A0ABV4U8M4_9BACT